jgi:predicted porin
MKKSLIALAALAATTAFAQSSVTISGAMDAGVMNQKFDNGTNVTNVSTGTNGASRLRFVGVEDIGNGTKANFWLEMQPSFQDGTTSAAGLFNRGAWLGLSDTTFGEIRLGRQGTNSVAAVCDIDQQGCYTGVSGGGILFSGIGGAGAAYGYWMAANPTRGGIAQPTGLTTAYNAGTAVSGVAINNVLASSTGAINQTNPNGFAQDSTRYVRAVRYSLPSFVTGLSINASYAFGQQLVTGGHAGDSSGFDANYVNGPLKLTAAYQKANGERVATTGSATTAATLGPVGASGELTTVGAIYNLGFASIGAGYQSEKATPGAANTPNQLQFTKGEGFALTALVPLGAFTPYIKYGERKYSGGSFGTFTPTKMTNIGVRYALSKRTYVYADYVQNGSNVFVTGATQLFTQGSLESQTNIGITHAF